MGLFEIVIPLSILLAGLFITYTLYKSRMNRYIIFIVLFVTIGMFAYTLSDSSKEPREVVSDNGIKNLECDEEYTLRYDIQGFQGTAICYNESPFGHYVVGLFQLATGIFALSYVIQNDIFSWREFYTPKILSYVNKYTGSKHINRYIETDKAGDFVWTYKGYGFLRNTKENEIHISRRDLYLDISNLSLFKGKAQAISTVALFEFVGKNEDIFRRIMKDNKYNIKTHRPIDEMSTLKIFMYMELSNSEKELYHTVHGNYSFGADRTKFIIRELFKMKRYIEYLNVDITNRTTKTLGTALDFSKSSANIGHGVRRLKQEDIVRVKPNEPQQQPNNMNQRGQM